MSGKSSASFRTFFIAFDAFLSPMVTVSDLRPLTFAVFDAVVIAQSKFTRRCFSSSCFANFIGFLDISIGEHGCKESQLPNPSSGAVVPSVVL